MVRLHNLRDFLRFDVTNGVDLNTGTFFKFYMYLKAFRLLCPTV